MLVVGPLQTLRQFAIPLVIGLVGISSSGGGVDPMLAGPMILLPLVLGLIPWLTTRFRVTESQFLVRRGLLNRQQVTAPLDRVRSVDLESSLLHRLLGLTKVQIGTGVDDTRIELNALTAEQADSLRTALLSRRALPAQPASADQPGGAPAGTHPPAVGLPEPAAVPQVEPPRLLARIDWSWLRFAPFSLSRLAIVAGAVGLLSQWADSLPFLDRQHVDSAWQWVLGFAIPLVILVGLISATAIWVVIAVVGYVVQWWDLTLTRQSGALRLTAGLFTTRSTTVEEARIRGVHLTEPVLLRLVHGGELATLATGVGSGGVTKVLPPSPVEVCHAVGHDILEYAGPLTDPLAQHGRAARRRCLIRAQWTPLLLTVGAAWAVWQFDRPWWVPVLVAVVTSATGILVGLAAYAHLGHRLDERHLTSGWGALSRQRAVLERDGIIGWVIRQSFFQRRRGLATLVATTAAGSEKVEVMDVPLATAVAVADEATPGLLAPFRSA